MSLTIAETAERTGLTAHTLRYYERDGLMLSVDRSPTGHRRYSEGDLEWIAMITRLRRTGMPIRDVRRYAELARTGRGTEAERMEILRRHREMVRAQLEETRHHLDLIDRKIEWYAGTLTSSALEGEHSPS